MIFAGLRSPELSAKSTLLPKAPVGPFSSALALLTFYGWPVPDQLCRVPRPTSRDARPLRGLVSTWITFLDVPAHRVWRLDPIRAGERFPTSRRPPGLPRRVGCPARA